jgi:hypothetical protein
MLIKFWCGNLLKAATWNSGSVERMLFQLNISRGRELHKNGSVLSMVVGLGVRNRS